MSKFYVYIILCKNGSYYTGHSRNVSSRFLRHADKAGARFTAQNVPDHVVWSQAFDTELEAVKWEIQIKGWSRKKKENLINGIWK